MTGPETDPRLGQAHPAPAQWWPATTGPRSLSCGGKAPVLWSA
jgi:hypothetical protein